MKSPRLQFVSDKSNKFWEAEVDGTTLKRTYGKIGTAGREQLNPKSTVDEARNEFNRLLLEKLSEGYQPVDFPELPLVENPEVLDSQVLGGDFSEEVATDICSWLTTCIQAKMSIKRFEALMEKFEYGDHEVRGALSYFVQYTGRDGGIFEGHLREIYQTAFERGADRFAWTSMGSMINICALKGDPGVAKIEAADLQEGAGECTWPDIASSEGTPIVGLIYDLEQVVVRSGEKYNNLKTTEI